MNTLRWKRHLGVIGLVIATGFGAGAAWAYTVPLATPPGITLVNVYKLMEEGAPQFLWLRLGDASGNPLYTYDADQGGKSSCYDDCAREFPPFLADSHAVAFGDWSLVVRDNDKTFKQWAYQGRPLYSYSGKDLVGEPQGGRFQLVESPAWHDPSSKTYSPKSGWRRASYTPEKSTAMPTSVQLSGLAVADGFGFVDPATRMTIYAAPVSHKLSGDWKSVRAAALSGPVGEFSIITRKDDGTRQWTYKGEALYTYAGDYAPGDANGIFAGDKSIQAALAYRNFIPSGITIGHYVGRGPLLTTSKGQTLYYTSRFHATYGGREAPGGYYMSYNELKSQGTVGCQGDCTVTWKPMLAPANAQASGFWELITRPEGSQQWAFKGSPVYTFVGDRKPGDIEGNNRYVIVYGGAHGEIVYADAGTDPRDPQPRLGNLTMLAAVGAAPGQKADYVAGAGFVGAGSQADGVVGAAGGGRPGAAAGGRRGGAGAAGGGAAAGGGGRGGGAPDHGAGFEWFTVPLFYGSGASY